MKTLMMFDIQRRRALVTRESARSIESNLCSAVGEGHGAVALDFAGVDVITPSYLDELLAIIEGCIQSGQEKLLRVSILHAHTTLSVKLAMIGRARGLSISETGDGTWTITRETSSAQVGG